MGSSFERELSRQLTGTTQWFIYNGEILSGTVSYLAIEDQRPYRYVACLWVKHDNAYDILVCKLFPSLERAERALARRALMT